MHLAFPLRLLQITCLPSPPKEIDMNIGRPAHAAAKSGSILSARSNICRANSTL